MSQLFIKLKKKNITKNAFSYVELLIAITILVFSASFILTIFNSRTNEAQKSMRHYVAMFIAGKVLEDIDNNIRENPFYLPELKFYDKTYKVIDRDSPFFTSLEDFNLDGKLNEEFFDFKGGFDLRKLEGYEYKISVSPITDYASFSDLIASVKVTVMWPDGSAKKEYSLSASYSGYPAPFEQSEINFDATITPQMIEDMKAALGAGVDIKTLAQNLGDDYSSLYNLSLLSIIIEYMKKVEHEADVDIETLKNSSTMDLYTKINLARLYEKKSVALMGILNYLRYPASRILKQMKEGNFKIEGFLNSNPSCVLKMKENIGLLRKKDLATGAVVANSFILKFNETIKLGFMSYIDMLSMPTLASKLGLRERQSIFLKIIDMGLALALNKNENTIINIDGFPISAKQVVKNCLRNLQKYYELRNIPRTKYIMATLDKFNDSSSKTPAEKSLEKSFDDINNISKLCEILYQSF
ncbi:MAG TPA: hypothetical protein PKK26_06930 [Candidatus Wallbacteria bacterium]|nr:hypothetical protein [Candidatus Wallbacteria bacterium]